MSTTYSATATREGKWWMIRIPEIDGLTQARKLDQAAGEARDYIAASQGIPVEDVAVTIAVEQVGGLDIVAENAAIADARYQASVAERDATDRAARLAKNLAANELSVREIGVVMGVSHQRAQQLLHR